MTVIKPGKLLTAKAGHGMDGITLGMPLKEVKRTLGKPDSANTYSEEIWWSYFALGIDCGFYRGTKVLLALNFFRDGVAGHKAARVTTEEGLCPGVPKLVVLQRLGEPYESGSDWIDQMGVWYRSWIAYLPGIAFEFGRDGRVDVMTIYHETAKSTEKPVLVM